MIMLKRKFYFYLKTEKKLFKCMIKIFLKYGKIYKWNLKKNNRNKWGLI